MSFAQIGFRLLALGDVGGDSGESYQVVRGVPHLKAAIVDPANTPVGASDSILDANSWFIFHQRTECRHYMSAILRQNSFDPLVRMRVQLIDLASPNALIATTDIMHFGQVS